MNRTERLLEGAERGARLIEIGPGYNPIAPKSAGWNTHVVDHASREALRTKYAGAPVNIDRIEEVDSIWTDGPVHAAIDSRLHGSFDMLLASHVIEHVPDFVGFFASAALLLKPAGVVSLAVPDKRYCFDYFKPLSTTGDVLEAFRSHRTRHSFQARWDHLAYAISLDGVSAWGQHPVREPAFLGPFEDAVALFEVNADRAADYVDCHAWKFTPASFELIVYELTQLGIFDWRIDAITGAAGCEFLVRLRRGAERKAGAEIQEHRKRLLRRQLGELQEQLGFALSGGLLAAPGRGSPEEGRDPVAAVSPGFLREIRYRGHQLRARLSRLRSRLQRLKI